MTTAAEVVAGLLRSKPQPALGKGSLWSHRALLREAPQHFHALILLQNESLSLKLLRQGIRCPKRSSEWSHALEKCWLWVPRQPSSQNLIVMGR